jgi:Transglycosylase SLT domain
VSVDLVRAIIQTESDFDAQAVSSKGARGLMQLMPDTARRFGVADSFDPRQNIFGGVKYLRLLLDMFQGNVALAAAAYNSGENSVLKYNGVPPYKETQDYVAKVQTLLGTVTASAGPGTAQAMFLTPGNALIGGAVPVPTAIRTVRASALATRPRTYFKWQDGSGGLHVSEVPPADGVVYTTVRALD